MACTSFFGTRVVCSPLLAPRRPAAVFQPIEASYGNVKKIGPGRKWEKYDLTKNGKPVRVKMHVKSGDTVQVIAGRDKGKVATIQKVYSKTGFIICEGVNILTKHVAPRTSEETGQIKKLEGPIHHSNVQLYSKEQNVTSRVGHKVLEDGKKVRYLLKTGEIIDS